MVAIDVSKLSRAEQLSMLPEAERQEILAELTAGMSEDEIEDLKKDWRLLWARPNQLAPDESCTCGCRGQWINWVILAGRGWGKTRTGSEWVHENINNGTYKLMHLIGATASDARDIMVLGESGLLATQKRHNRVQWSPTKRRLTWENGAEALVFSADEPDRLRGLQCEAAWADELAAWRYEDEAWSQVNLGLRLGPFPRALVTTTPRPKQIIRNLVADKDNHVTRGSTYDNSSNLAKAFLNEITNKLEGDRFGRQEIYAEILDESDMAYWTRKILDDNRITVEAYKETVELKKIVIGVDVAVSFGKESAETGIVVAGLGFNDKAYVLHDASGRYRPDGWAKRVSALYHSYMNDAAEVRVVAEKNQGYELIRHTIEVEDPEINVKLVHASKNKLTRAEPVATAYERGRVKHVGTFPKLEDQMCTYEAGDLNSPDRLDALVWALTELVVGKVIAVAIPMMGNELGKDVSYWRNL